MPQIYTPGQSNAYHLSRRIASQAAHEQMRNYGRAHQSQSRRQKFRQNIHNSLAPGPYDRWDLIPQSQQPSLRPGLSNQSVGGWAQSPSDQGWSEHVDYSRYNPEASMERLWATRNFLEGKARKRPGEKARTPIFSNKPRTRRKLRPTQMPKKVKSSAPRRKKGMRNRPY